MIEKTQNFLIKQKIKFDNRIYLLATETTNIVNEAQTTKFTKKIPKILATICCSGIALLMPTTAFASAASFITKSQKNTSSNDDLDDFVDFLSDWLKVIGFLLMLVGGVMFALGWQKEDADGKTRGLQVLIAGGMVAAIGLSPNILSLSS